MRKLGSKVTLQLRADDGEVIEALCLRLGLKPTHVIRVAIRRLLAAEMGRGAADTPTLVGERRGERAAAG
jgi:hypothetical protein